MEESYEQFAKQFPKMQTGRDLAEISSMGIGGPADLYCRLEKTGELPALIETAEKLGIPYIILGGGTNTIFASEGFRGLIIHIMTRKVALEPSNDPAHGIVSAEAGALTSQVIAFALKNNLSGLEKLTGLPGTIGGAVRGNAGAFGTEIKDFFYKAVIYTPGRGLRDTSPSHGLREAGPEYFKFSYRHSAVKNSEDIILKVFLKLERRDTAQDTARAMEEAAEIAKNRIIKQPKGHSTGSFFKNPGADLKAGYLLDQCGCKGLQVGDAQVAHEHANWIINRGRATQKDVIELAKMMRERVKERFDITLVPEVQLVGPAGFINL